MNSTGTKRRLSPHTTFCWMCAVVGAALALSALAQMGVVTA